METSTFDIKFAGTVIILFLIYRLPSTSVLQFCNDMTDIMERRITDDLGKLLLIGDFNIHIDEPTEPDTITFLDFLNSFQPHQSCSMANTQIRTYLRFTYQ